MTTTTPTPLRHRPRCPGPDLHEFDGRKGDRMERCAACDVTRRISRAKPEAAPVAEPAPVPEDGRGPAERAGARYVCRMHPAEAVNWRGNGCPRCARKNAPRRTDRPADEL